MLLTVQAGQERHTRGSARLLTGMVQLLHAWTVLLGKAYLLVK